MSSGAVSRYKQARNHEPVPFEDIACEQGGHPGTATSRIIVESRICKNRDKPLNYTVRVSKSAVTSRLSKNDLNSRIQFIWVVNEK